MKKLMILLLVLALLVPMCLVANAETAKKSFQGVTWGKEISGYSNIENLYAINISMQPGEDSAVVSLGSLVYGKYTDDQVTAMAEKMKKDLNARPEGQRYIHFFGPKKAMELADNVIYTDEPMKQLAEMTDALFAKYYEIGGKVEGAMMSMLYHEISAYYINQEVAKNNAKLYGKIVKDPRYQTEIRPLLKERGFVFYDGTLTDYTPEIYGISGKAGAKYANCQAIWNTVMKNRLNDFIRQWAYEPMAKYFPDVHVSDYQSVDSDARLKPVSIDGNVIGSVSGDGYRAGNTSSDKYYSNTPTNSEFYGEVGTSYKNIPTYMGTTYKETSFNNFKFDMNTAKQAYWADPEHAVSYWVNAYKTSNDNNTTVGNSPYYAEQVFHLNLYDPKPFVVFTGDDLEGEELAKPITIANDLLAELTRVVGYADRKAIGTPIDWNSEFMLSGMYANGKNYWRITPNRDYVSKEGFKVAGSDPTFSVNGQTITFPGGKIIADQVTSVSTYGYWVETPANVTPLITSDADRFEKYPAYIENFESYADGTKLTAANVRDLNAWAIQPKGNDLTIGTVSGNKVLSVTGDSSMESKLVAANVTAGDEYAKKQSWEITVTIPEGMGADAQMLLLNYTAADTEVDDGGFKIQGGKLYYATGEEDEEYELVYKELMDLKPGTYTLRREMNFGQTFYCNYVVTDASGKVLKSADKVEIPTFAAKVKTIGLKCTDMNVRLLLDNFILRATSAAADLYLYDAQLGLKQTVGAELTQTVNYRLSWANASAKNETATVKADITSGGKTTTKTLASITLKPGCDGVEYGTVTLKAGESAKVYLDTTIQDEKVELNPTEPTQAPIEPTQAPTEATKAPTTATKAPTTATRPATSKLTKQTVATKVTIATKATKATKATETTKATEWPLSSTPTKPVETTAPTQVTEITEVTQVTEITEVTQVTEVTELTQATEMTQITQATEATDATTPNEGKGDDKDSAIVPIIVAIAVVVLAAAGAAVYFFVIKKKPDAEEKTEE